MNASEGRVAALRRGSVPFSSDPDMLYLFFSVGDQQYALRSERIRQIVPNVRLRSIPGCPVWIRGLLNYHDCVVPVLDLSTLLEGRVVSAALGSRIILIDRSGPGSPERGCEGLLGLLAEKVLEVHSVSEEEIRSLGAQAFGARSLGRVVIRHGEMIQLVEVDELLSGDRRNELLSGLRGGDA